TTRALRTAARSATGRWRGSRGSRAGASSRTPLRRHGARPPNARRAPRARLLGRAAPRSRDPARPAHAPRSEARSTTTSSSSPLPFPVRSTNLGPVSEANVGPARVSGTQIRYEGRATSVLSHRLRATVIAGPHSGSECQVTARALTIGAASDNQIVLAED